MIGMHYLKAFIGKIKLCKLGGFLMSFSKQNEALNL